MYFSHGACGLNFFCIVQNVVIYLLSMNIATGSSYIWN
jgi:hypothetical protein